MSVHETVSEGVPASGPIDADEEENLGRNVCNADALVLTTSFAPHRISIRQQRRSNFRLYSAGKRGR